MVRVDLRTIVLDIPPQDLITRDNVPAKVNAVTYFRVVDAPSAVVKVERYLTRDLADRPDHAALGAGQGRPRHAARRARAPQRGAPADHRRADRPVGRQGHGRRDQGRRDPGGDAARDGAPGGGRARAPREGDPRRRRVPGVPAPPRRRRGDRAPIPPRCSCATCRRSPRSASTRTRPSSSPCRSTSSGRSWRVPARRADADSGTELAGGRQTSPLRSVPATAATGSSIRRDDPPKRRRSAIAAAPNDRSMLAAAVCMRSAAAGRRAGRQRSA